MTRTLYLQIQGLALGAVAICQKYHHRYLVSRYPNEYHSVNLFAFAHPSDALVIRQQWHHRSVPPFATSIRNGGS